MNVIVTTHSKQRRPEFEEKHELEIKMWMEYFIKRFNIIFMTKDGTYRIKYKEKGLIFTKEKMDIKVITIYGFDDCWEIKEDINFKMKLQSNPRFIRINRITSTGRVKKCGQIMFTKNGLDLQLSKILKDKYKCEVKLQYNKVEEIPIIEKDKFGRLCLKPFDFN